MALKKLKVKINPAPATGKNGDIPVVAIEGDLIKQYNEADKQMKAAEAVMNDLKPEILELGITEIFTRSCSNTKKDPTLTVKLQDDEAEVLRVQFTKRYSAVADVDAVETLFTELKSDINEYVQEVVVPKFDDSVLYDADGNFDQKVYDEFRIAIERVAKKLGKDCPLKTAKAVKPKELFHVERFRKWPDAAVQMKLTACLPNTTQVVPVTVKADK